MRAAMSKLWFKSALLVDGWAADVRLTTADGRIERIEVGTPSDADDERHAIAVPGLPNVHSHAFQRGLAGLTERRGPTGPNAAGGAEGGVPTDDSFWTWRELMYRFVERIDPEGVET